MGISLAVRVAHDRWMKTAARTGLMLAILLWVAACGNGTRGSTSSDKNGDGDSSEGDGDGDGDGVTGSAPVPGVSQDGWESDYKDQGGGCDRDEAGFAALSHVSFGDTTVYVGFEQVSSNNQDPIVARFDGGEMIYCHYHENDGPDGRALGITWDGGEYAYVVYTIVGGGSDLENKGGWLNSYAPGAISGWWRQGILRRACSRRRW